MSAGDLVLAAPARRAGSFAQAGEALVCMDLYHQERGNRVGSAQAAADGKLRLERHLDWYGFNASDFQAICQSPLSKVVHKSRHLTYNPLQELLSLRGGGQVGMPNRAALCHLVKFIHEIDRPPIEHIRFSIAVLVARSVPIYQRQLQ